MVSKSSTSIPPVIALPHASTSHRDGRVVPQPAPIPPRRSSGQPMARRGSKCTGHTLGFCETGQRIRMPWTDHAEQSTRSWTEAHVAPPNQLQDPHAPCKIHSGEERISKKKKEEKERKRLKGRNGWVVQRGPCSDPWLSHRVPYRGALDACIHQKPTHTKLWNRPTLVRIRTAPQYA